VVQGDKLQSAAKEAETRRQRLEELAADLATANAAATEAERVHHEHVAALEPLRRRHRRSTVRHMHPSGCEHWSWCLSASQMSDKHVNLCKPCMLMLALPAQSVSTAIPSVRARALRWYVTPQSH